ncbi:hypothetical protein LCGC14_1871020 [marine sediment metagenome]|uniref:Uncharacterized protein n=1 Tax=marine sediment metagenome TaxID=412755 RepID=A0A0F9J3U7_9ZZZZ
MSDARAILPVAIMALVFSVMAVSLAFGAMIMTLLGPTTTYIPVTTLVPWGEVEAIGEQFDRDGVVQRCQDLPLTTDPYAEVVPIVCMLEVPE